MLDESLTIGELIPGYTATQRLGAGGYGEVWKAEAPGGLAKAIKLVYGFLDDDRAAREFKALNRIKEARHPFLLSLERIEVVDRRLVIVTELADKSLLDRFKECQAEGLKGLARKELLRYLGDAADALDYMLEEHSLQHLDVKPENLLLVGGRCKIGDFGLVKELVDRTNSMVAGMTPIYASPEIFDGRASRQSDQYSLAIVYQEMLTGALPFPGRTPAQLASQHTQARPRLSSLPEGDRPAIDRALSKRPEDRFPSCRELIDALMTGGQAPTQVAGTDRRSGSKGAAARSDSQSGSINETRRFTAPGQSSPGPNPTERQERRDAIRRRSSAQRPKAREERPEVEVSIDVRDLAPLEMEQAAAGLRPTLFIGIGGAGARVLKQLKLRLDRWHDSEEVAAALPMLLLDTDRDALKNARAEEKGAPLRDDDVLLMSLRKPQDYQRASPKMFQWLSRRWLYNIPRSMQTQGFRALGRLALVDHAEDVLAAIHHRLAALAEEKTLEDFHQATGLPVRSYAVRVYVIGSVSGGTSSGTLVDVAYAVDNLLAEFNQSAADCIGVLLHATNCRPTEKDLAMANAHACLTELQHAARYGNKGQSEVHPATAPFLGEGSPFHHTYFLHLGDDLRDEDYDKQIEQVAEYLFCDAATPAGPILEACRTADNPQEENQVDLQLHTFGLATAIADQVELPLTSSACLLTSVAKRWLGDAKSSPTRETSSLSDTTSPPSEPRPAPDHRATPEVRYQWLTTQFAECFEEELGPLAKSPAALRARSLLEESLNREFEDPQRVKKLDVARLLEEAMARAVRLADFLREVAVGSCFVMKTGEDDDSEPVSAREMTRSFRRCAGPIADGLRTAMSSLTEEVDQRFWSSSFEPLFADLSAASDELPQSESLLDQLRAEARRAVLRTLKELDHTLSVGEDGRLRLTPERIRGWLHEASLRIPIQCGAVRRLFVVQPEGTPDEDLRAALQTEAPRGSTVVPGPVPETVYCYEGGQLSLAQVAARLTEDRPDLVDAARRLHTRVDIQWTQPPLIKEQLLSPLTVEDEPEPDAQAAVEGQTQPQEQPQNQTETQPAPQDQPQDQVET